MATTPELSAPRPSMKERQRQLREEAILDATVEFLQSKGFDAMTLDDITESIGISRPTLYQHFCSKEEMVVHCALRNLLRGVEKLREIDRNGGSPRERLIQFLDWTMEFRFGSCSSIFTDLAHIVVAAKERNERYRTAGEEFKLRFARLLVEGQATGDVRSDIRAPLLVEMIVAVFKSAGFDELTQSGEATREEVRQCLYKLLTTSP